MMFKIATWNVNSLRVRLPHVLDWLARHQPDVLAIQETKTQDPDFPLEEIQAAGYQAIFSGQKTFNGVAMLSKQPATAVVTDFPDFDDPQRRVLAATIGEVRVINLYVPNGSELGSEKYQYKLRWLSQLKKFLQQQLTDHSKLVVLGDFNIAPEDADVHDPQAWQGSVLVSDQEREALSEIIELGFIDVFRQFKQEPETFSWWDYRGGQFWKNKGLRIDLILANTDYAQQCESSVVDIRPRKLQRPSDHAPVLAQFVMP